MSEVSLPCLSAVGLELSSVGRLQQQLCGDSVRTCDVFSLQPADSSSAAHTNTAQPGQFQHQHTHHLPHRHTHQSHASHQGNSFMQIPFPFPRSNDHLILQTYCNDFTINIQESVSLFTRWYDDECRLSLFLMPDQWNLFLPFRRTRK